MSQQAPTECPKCGQDLTIAMRNWWLVATRNWLEGPGRLITKFQFICPNCRAEMQVRMDMLPTFSIQEEGEK